MDLQAGDRKRWTWACLLLRACVFLCFFWGGSPKKRHIHFKGLKGLGLGWDSPVWHACQGKLRLMVTCLLRAFKSSQHEANYVGAAQNQFARIITAALRIIIEERKVLSICSITASKENWQKHRRSACSIAAKHLKPQNRALFHVSTYQGSVVGSGFLSHSHV